MLILTVRVCALRASFSGVLAQLVERLNGIEEVRGSNPLGSTEVDQTSTVTLDELWLVNSTAPDFAPTTKEATGTSP